MSAVTLLYTPTPQRARQRAVLERASSHGGRAVGACCLTAASSAKLQLQ